MARLIIGHVSDSTATIWVRGDRRYPYAHVRVYDNANSYQKTVGLEERHGYTGIVEAKGLQANGCYQCEVAFSERRNSQPNRWVDYGHCRGQFRTAPTVGKEKDFTFLLGSCNLHALGPVSSPDRAFEELLDKAKKHAARFMIHCGDQIYYDIPNLLNSPDIEEYRSKYLDAWGDSRPTRKFLTQLPQYMIMDDHEITNDFANDFRPPMFSATPQQFKQISMKVYREFVHIRHPKGYGNQALYYDFSYGSTQFFIMDVRTERFGYTPGANQIVGEEQMSRFKRWLKCYKDDLKFVVTSVPFVCEVRKDNDKWCAPAFKAQRDEVVDFIESNDINSIVFLTGDMHSSCHATMSIKRSSGCTVVHELMSSPINQLEKSNFDKYVPSAPHQTGNGTPYQCRVRKAEYYTGHSNAMLVSVNGKEISWEIFRTKKTAKGKAGKFVV